MTWQVEAVMAEREGDEAQGEEGGRGRTDRRVASGECEAAAVRDVSACGDERGLRVADVAHGSDVAHGGDLVNAVQ